MLCNNSLTAFSMAGILYEDSRYGWKTIFFLPKSLEKGHFFLKFWLEFQPLLSGYPEWTFLL